MKSVTSDRHQQARPDEPGPPANIKSGDWDSNTDSTGRFVDAEDKDRNWPSLRFGQSRKSSAVLSMGKKFSRRSEVNSRP
jgi:hypothetical protein